MSTEDLRALIQNRVILKLPPADREQLIQRIEPVHLPLGRLLYETGGAIDYVYFHNNGMSSLISHTEEGGRIEVGMVGYEGVTGLPAFLGTGVSEHLAVMQIKDDGNRMKAEEFKAFCDRMASLREIMLRYTQAMITQLTQSVVCSRFHTIEQRLCRWLLVAQDAVRSDELNLTQEFLASMLGVNRPGVTLAARLLQNAGLIDYARGHIIVRDRPGLEASSCECYRIIRSAFEWLYTD